jgi:TldD protein
MRARPHTPRAFCCACLLLSGLWWLPVAARAAEKQDGLLDLLGEELAYSREHLAMPDGTRPYYVAYTVVDQQSVGLGATLGTLLREDTSRRRMLDTDVRVGDYDVDNTHKLRSSGYGFDFDFDFGMPTLLSLTDDSDSIRHALWLATDEKFKAAAKKFERVQTNLKTMVEEEDKSGDFTHETPSVHSEPAVDLELDAAAWADRLRNASQLARDYPLIYDSSVSLQAQAVNQYMVSSEGERIQFGQKYFRVIVSASTKAEDGMELEQNFIFDSCCEAKLPGEQEVAEAFKKVITQVLALRAAPLVEPYVGPAILMNRASAVFFHEIFGHRIEGHRQKDVEEGQTYAKKIGELVLPDFITVRDDPTLAEFNGNDLRGYYRFDDEGVAPSDVMLVDHGVLKTFLMSRSPLKDCPHSNGHGRRQPGQTCVARQGNLLVESSNVVPVEQLRQKMIEECRKQDKPYGLLFDDIAGGYTGTTRWGPQSFKVLPIVVYKVYADGRPDELVRGVDIVGTPLTCFSKILCTGDDPAIFNGTCGAESGMVPVSGVSPSILVSQIEVEKRVREQDKPPILPPPIAEQSRK